MHRLLLVLLLAALRPVAAQQYMITTVAGGAPPSTPALGVSVSIGMPNGVAADATGNLYFAVLGTVFKVDPEGLLTRVAGNSRDGYSGDGGPATSAQVSNPYGLAVDSLGNLFIADGERIRRVSPSGIITTVAGGGAANPGDGGSATNAQLKPYGVAVDSARNLFIADGSRVRKVAPNGIITTVAGNGTYGLSGDGGPATSAQLSNPEGVAVDGAGNLFIADHESQRIRKVSPSGIISTLASGIPAVGIAVDGAGNVYTAEGIRALRISPDGLVTKVAGNSFDFSGDGGPATGAGVTPWGVAVDGGGNLFIADRYNFRIRKVSPSGIITTVAGNGREIDSSGDGGPATRAQLSNPSSVAVDKAGNLFIADRSSRIRKVSPTGTIVTVAGSGTQGFSGDGGPATSAQLTLSDIAVDGANNLLIADARNGRIRKVSSDGTITTVAGGGSADPGDSGLATSARLSGPGGVAVDAAGNMFIADGTRIRQVSPTGIITTIAGDGTYGFSGDGGPAISAQLSAGAVAVDRDGNLFIVDGESRIRRISPEGIITTVAGGGPANRAELSNPVGVAVDSDGNLFISDPGIVFFTGFAEGPENRILKLSRSGILTTVAGNGAAGFTGDGGPATNATFLLPAGLATDGAGNVYIADSLNNAVRILRPVNEPVISAVIDAASQQANPVSPGKIVVIYGVGLGPSQLIQNQSSSGQFGNELEGTTVSFNGIAAPILYASAAQLAVIVPYAVTGTTAQVTLSYLGQVSAPFAVPVAASAPSLFTSNETGAGEAAALNAADRTVNTAANPVKIGAYLSLYATGEGQTTPGGVDGTLSSTPARPVLPVIVTVGGIPASVQYAGSAAGQVAGLMQLNVQIPSGVTGGGYVPLVLQVGDKLTTPGAVWVAVSGN